MPSATAPLTLERVRARVQVLRECADIVRRHYTEPPEIDGGWEPLEAADDADAAGRTT